MSYVWNAGGQPLIGVPAPTPPNTNRAPGRMLIPSQQIDTRHYTPNQIRNMQAAYASGGVTPLPTLGYDTTAISGGGSITRGVTDPLGSGRTDMTYRQVPGSGGTTRRAEDFQVGYNSPYSTRMVPSDPFWVAHGFSIRPGYDLSRGGGADTEMLVWQTHTQADGDTQPDFALYLSGQGATSMRWRAAYNQHPPADWNYNGGAFPDTTASTVIYTTTLPAAAQRILFMARHVPGYTSGQGPQIDIWMSINGAALSQVVTAYTGLNTYNVTGWGVEPSYIRHGPYKWSSSADEPNDLGFYHTPYYWGRESSGWGEANARAALQPWM